MNAQLDGVDESIRAKMCHQLVDDNSWKTVYVSVTCSTTKSGSINLQVDPIKQLSKGDIINTEEDAMIDKLIVFTDF